jgi:hypothetical protein
MVPELDLARVGRDVGQTGVRAALISATQFLIQRAALELDIDPDEFDALEPRVARGQPVLQIADYLPNGAGFCRRLSAGDTPLLLRLMRDMVDDPRADRLLRRYFENDHPQDCKAACYRCLQRYGNRSHHGLLDWRLGLSALRVLVHGDWKAGIDGQWAAPELSTWLEDSAATANDLASLMPDRFVRESAGRLGLSCVRTTNGSPERFVLVHPFWVQGAVRETLGNDHFRGRTYFVDTFQASRRPQRVIDLARQGCFGGPVQ